MEQDDFVGEIIPVMNQFPLHAFGETTCQAISEIGRQGVDDEVLSLLAQRFEVVFPRLDTVPLRSVRHAQPGPADDDINVFGESLNQPPPLRQRRSSFERQMLADARQREELLEYPANPEILLNAGGRQPQIGGGLLAVGALLMGRQAQVTVHRL